MLEGLAREGQLDGTCNKLKEMKQIGFKDVLDNLLKDLNKKRKRNS